MKNASRDPDNVKLPNNALSYQEFVDHRKMTIIHDKEGNNWFVCNRHRRLGVLGTLFRGKSLKMPIFVPDSEQPMEDYGITWQGYTLVPFDAAPTPMLTMTV